MTTGLGRRTASPLDLCPKIPPSTLPATKGVPTTPDGGPGAPGDAKPGARLRTRLRGRVGMDGGDRSAHTDSEGELYEAPRALTYVWAVLILLLTLEAVSENLRARRPTSPLRAVVPRRHPGRLGGAHLCPGIYEPRGRRAWLAFGAAGGTLGDRLDRLEHRLRRPGQPALPHVRRRLVALVVPADRTRDLLPDPGPTAGLRAAPLDGRDRGHPDGAGGRFHDGGPARGHQTTKGMLVTVVSFSYPVLDVLLDWRHPRRVRPARLAPRPHVDPARGGDPSRAPSPTLPSPSNRSGA